MKTRLVENPSDELSDVLRSIASEPSVQGLGIFAGEGKDIDPRRFNSMLRELTIPVFGGVFPEVIYKGERKPDSVVVVGVKAEPNVSVVPELSDSDTEFDEHLPENTQQDGTAFVLVDAYASRAEDFVGKLFARYGVNLTYLGGGGGSLDMEQRPCLITNEGLVEDAAIFATFETTTTVGVKHGWKEIAGPLRATDTDGPTLAELDGEPAFPVYKRIVEDDADVTLTRSNFFDIAKEYPFGISRIEGEKIVRDPFEVTDDGALTCFGDIPEGAFLNVLKGDEDSLAAAAGEAYDTIAAEADGNANVVLFDCISRVLYLEEAFERELEFIGDDECPEFGALTIGEIANDGEGHLDYYNKTVVAAVTNSL